MVITSGHSRLIENQTVSVVDESGETLALENKSQGNAQIKNFGRFGYFNFADKVVMKVKKLLIKKTAENAKYAKERDKERLVILEQRELSKFNVKVRYQLKDKLLAVSMSFLIYFAN